MQHRIACTLALCASLGVGSFWGQDNHAPDPVASLRSAWIQALETKNVDASIALYEPDATFLTPDGGRYSGLNAIRGLYRIVAATYTSRIKMTSARQQCSGELCVENGEYSEEMAETATGNKLHPAGSYVLAARRQPDGTWKITELAWTVVPGTMNESDAAKPAPAR